VVLLFEFVTIIVVSMLEYHMLVAVCYDIWWVHVTTMFHKSVMHVPWVAYKILCEYSWGSLLLRAMKFCLNKII